MSTIKLVVSDLHLADGNDILDGFGDYQQAAFEGLLRAANPNGPLGRANDVELIINGDCFDFLVTPPYNQHGTVDIPTAVGKLEKIIAAHTPFFEALRQFLAEPGRHITLITGNHDIEFRFEPVRKRILDALGGKEAGKGVTFCPTRFYRPLPDVYIEHGNYYDFWNHARTGLWDEEGQPLTITPETITMPLGSHYFQEAAYPMSVNYPYFDHFEPSMNIVRQIALLCLLNPPIVMETARRVSAMMSQPYTPLARLAEGEEHIPAQLFAAAMVDFVAFQQDMQARKTDWTPPAAQDTSEGQRNAMMEFSTLSETLAQTGKGNKQIAEAVTAICTPTTYQMGEDVAKGMHNVLKNDQNLRYAIAGHTHMVRIDQMENGVQTYLNTASWTTRFALPAPGDITDELIEWLRQPDWQAIPLRDITELIFAMITTNSDGETAETTETAEPPASSASLCVWEGGVKGSYRVLA